MTYWKWFGRLLLPQLGVKDLSLFGVVGGIVGTITSIMSVISVLTSSTGEDECVVSFFYSFKVSVHSEWMCTLTLICY